MPEIFFNQRHANQAHQECPQLVEIPMQSMPDHPLICSIIEATSQLSSAAETLLLSALQRNLHGGKDS